MIPPTAQRRALQHGVTVSFASRPRCVAHLVDGRKLTASCRTRTARLWPIDEPHLWATPLCGRCIKIVASWPEASVADRIQIEAPDPQILLEAVSLAPTVEVLTSIDLEATIRGVRCWSGESTAPWQKQLAQRRRQLKQAADPTPLVRPRVKRSAELSAIEYVENRKSHRRHYNAIARAIQSNSSR